MKKLELLIKNCEGCIYCGLTDEIDEKTHKLKSFCSEQSEFIPDTHEIAPFCKLEDSEV